MGLLQSDSNPEVMLLAARALTFLADVLPASCSSIVRHGAVPAFCERLLNIEYIDLAEQSLQVWCTAGWSGSRDLYCWNAGRGFSVALVQHVRLDEGFYAPPACIQSMLKVNS